MREAVSGAARRWLAGGGLWRAPALVPARVPTQAVAPRAEAWSRARRRGDHGFTLVEVMVAFVVLMIVLVPTASLVANSIGQAANARERLTALSLAEQYLELLNNTPFGAADVNKTPTFPALPKTGTLILQKAHTVRSSVAYTVLAQFSWASGQGVPDLCTSGSTPKVIDVQVTVRWSHTTQHITDTTVIDYPPAGLATYGFLAVQVNGDPASGPPDDAGGHPWSSRVQSVPVTVRSLPGTTPPTTTTVHPSSHGCVFQQVPPGTYKVSLTNPASPTAPSWVANGNEQTAVTQSSLTVSAGQVTAATFQYDEGSLVDLHYPSTTATDGLVTCPAAGTLECLVTGQAPATAARPASTPVAELSVRTSTGWAALRPGMASIAAAACAGTTRCLAVGYGITQSTGAPYADSVSSATGSTPDFTQDTVPGGITTFDSLTCSASTTCFAVGTGASGPVLLSAAVSGTGVAWTSDAPSGLTAVSSMSCPGVATCFATVDGASGPAVLSLAATGHTWVPDTLPPPAPAPTSLGSVACPGTATCYAIGQTSTGAEILSLAATGQTWVLDTPPAGVTVPTLTQLACPSTSECYAIGQVDTATSTVAAVLSLAAPSGTAPPSWVRDTASSATPLVSLSCPTTATCVAAGQVTVPPVLLARTGPTTWVASSFTLPAGTTLDSIPAVGCSPGGHCDAVGVVTTAT
ncbi:MAG: prepilin-type N-terminal cleavage/methylation domain-containing protein, partial [Acidimicrobiales bacterium]